MTAIVWGALVLCFISVACAFVTVLRMHRELKESIPFAEPPDVVKLIRHDGRHVPCLIERTGPTSFMAIPAEKTVPFEVASIYIDPLPAGADVGILFEEPDEE